MHFAGCDPNTYSACQGPEDTDMYPLVLLWPDNITNTWRPWLQNEVKGTTKILQITKITGQKQVNLGHCRVKGKDKKWEDQRNGRVQDILDNGAASAELIRVISVSKKQRYYGSQNAFVKDKCGA